MDIIQQVAIAADVSLVWRAWTEPDRITEWFAPAAVIEPKIGGKFELYFNPENRDSMSTKGCTILHIDKPKSLVFEWKGPDPFADIINRGELTFVEVSFEPGEEGTIVTLTHKGWKASPDWNRAREWHAAAWTDMLASLKSSLESGQGLLCCE